MIGFVIFLAIGAVLLVGAARRLLRLNGRLAGCGGPRGVVAIRRGAGRILICGSLHFAGSRRAAIFVLALEDG